MWLLHQITERTHTHADWGPQFLRAALHDSHVSYCSSKPMLTRTIIIMLAGALCRECTTSLCAAAAHLQLRRRRRRRHLGPSSAAAVAVACLLGLAQRPKRTPSPQQQQQQHGNNLSTVRTCARELVPTTSYTRTHRTYTISRARMLAYATHALGYIAWPAWRTSTRDVSSRTGARATRSRYLRVCAPSIVEWCPASVARTQQRMC